MPETMAAIVAINCKISFKLVIHVMEVKATPVTPDALATVMGTSDRGVGIDYILLCMYKVAGDLSNISIECPRRILTINPKTYIISTAV